MDLKKLLKTLKLNEGTISTILGVIVVLAVALLVVNYFKGLKSNTEGKITSTSTTNNQEVPTPGGQHTVVAGETLWSISEKAYGSGYDWKQIADANGLKDPGAIEAGQTLKIPEKTSTQLAQASPSESPMPTASLSPSPTPTMTISPTMSPTATPTMSPAPTMAPSQTNSIAAGTQYTIAKGDSLWKVAVRTYGDGFQWTKIWHANKQIKNPDLIFVGNTLQLPQ